MLKVGQYLYKQNSTGLVLGGGSKQLFSCFTTKAELKEEQMVDKILLKQLKPKRPLSSYTFFVKDYCSNNATTDLSVGERAKVISQTWRLMSPTDKIKYQEKADEYKKSLSNIDIPQKPKKPSGSFYLYVAANRDPTRNYIEQTAELRPRWRDLDEKDKKPFHEEFEKLTNEYNQKLVAYNKKIEEMKNSIKEMRKKKKL
ncbi:hypothetical protein CYY_000075 [Polysphondylium violaceum]|uniref:HMG box domain-containing protein n=1 Tax=Polysphondylium violaceum TaxID=133409 RepID=A0A8J4Q3F7_9MYCE|nr:hypothetical protein CYY_000075 [Polysphondylium violaceum]